MKKLLAVVVPTALLAGGLSAVGYAHTEAPPATEGPVAGKVIKLKDARLKFEINATDHDGGLQVFIDADQWKSMSIFHPDGRKVLTTRTQGVMAKQGGTELFMETGEPTFDDLPLPQLLKRWPEGRYEIRGVSLDGETMKGTARLTHDLPAGPELLSPLEGGAAQDPEQTVLRWNQVPPPNGSPIIGYQVLVVQPDTGLRSLPKVTLDVMMPPTADTFQVPSGFLKPGIEYEWEVLAVEKGGNQTLSSSTFVTTGG